MIYNWHLAGEENMLKECNKDKEQESFMKLRIQAKIAKNKIKKKEKECKVAEKKRHYKISSLLKMTKVVLQVSVSCKL